MTIDHTQISVWVVLGAVAVDAFVVLLMVATVGIATRAYRRRQMALFATYMVNRTAEMLHTLRTPLDATSLEDARNQIDESLSRLKGSDGDKREG